MSDVLERILETKRGELRKLRRRYTENDLVELAAAADPVRGFAARLDTVAESGPAVIAEIKKASPSKGVIRADFDPPAIAADYAGGGAACLSVLTDRDYFQGDNDFLVQARAACALPALRKDFTIAPPQVIEARAIGADAVLLIAAALSTAQLRELHACAREFGLDVLVEVHDGEELGTVQSALDGREYLLGINNRSLRTFETSLDTTRELLADCPPGARVVSESGIHTAEDVRGLWDAGVQRFLVGEGLMRADSPGEALRALIGNHSAS